MSDRKCLPTFADLIERLAITQLKEMLLRDAEYKKEIDNICYDIDLIIKEKDLKIDASLLRMVMLTGQLNLMIWDCKDKMKEFPEKYDFYLGQAHRLNGVRNQIRNLMVEKVDDVDTLKTNTETDGLEMNISL